MVESAPIPSPSNQVRADAAAVDAARDKQPPVQDQKRGPRAIGLPVLILIGALAGVCVGVVFGERARILEPIGSAYALMGDRQVYPFRARCWSTGMAHAARRLFNASWGPYLFMWAVPPASGC